MAINFPSSGLTVGQIVSLGDRSWEWDGEKWKSTGTTSGTPIGATIVFEGAVENAYQTTLTVAEPTADRTITLQNADGTVAFTSDIPTVTALTGSTNTWIPTITAANALTGTANFTYDGNILDVKNSGTASSIKLYCESSNAHYQAIKAAPHSGSSDWTLTLPPTVPSVSGQALTATTSGVASWATVGGDSDKIIDADSDTKIQVEESADEDKIRFDTGGTERAVLDSSGLEIKTGNLKVPSGNGIDFSATSDAAGMTSELLDDYEEGTFTPTLIAGSGTFGLSTAEGTYTKTGRMVNLQGRIIVSSISSPSGGVRIENLPFTCGPYGSGSAYVRILSSNSTEGFAGTTFSGYTQMDIRRQGTTASGDDWANKVAVGTQIFYSCSYSV